MSKFHSNNDSRRGVLDRVAARRAIYLALVVAVVFSAVRLFVQAWGPGPMSVLQWIITLLFVILLSQVASGAILSFLGFIQVLRGGDPLQINRLSPEQSSGDSAIPPPATAIVLPIYNEDVDRVFNGIEVMWKDLNKGRDASGFDFFILSDSNRPESWIREEWAWATLCKKLGASGRLFYRKRKKQIDGKSGNLADFCQRWGQRYRYMVVLDADSLMTGECLSRLVDAMEKHPQVGLIQTVPWMVLGNSAFRRGFQFVLRLCGPVFAAGANYWQQFSGSYWGHNAIIRVKPFIEFCDLPDLPEDDVGRRHILSHDTVEAALMRKAGYEVWVAPELDGSYEEGPPNLSDMIKRDRRWCQGNFQHFWFLFAPGINFSNRVHILMGILSYASSPLWLLFLILSGVEGFYTYRYAWYSALPTEPLGLPFPAAVWLLTLTFILLFCPKVFGWLAAIPRAREFGGFVKMSGSVLLETIFSSLLAPVVMLCHTIVVLSTLLGFKVSWGTQNRKDGQLGFWQCVREYWWVTAAGLLGGFACFRYIPPYFWWFSPVFLAWLVAIPLVYFTASEAVGSRLRSLKLFQIPEETHVPDVLCNLENPVVEDFARNGLKSAIEHPLINALHVMLLRQAESERAEELVQKIKSQGEGSLTLSEQMRVLWDPAGMAQLHETHWLNRNRANI